jgi:hypothetical protein
VTQGTNNSTAIAATLTGVFVNGTAEDAVTALDPPRSTPGLTPSTMSALSRTRLIAGGRAGPAAWKRLTPAKRVSSRSPAGIRRRPSPLLAGDDLTKGSDE